MPHFTNKLKPGLIQITKPGKISGLMHISLCLLSLKSGEVFEKDYPEYESVYVILSGTVNVEIANKVYKNLGRRKTVFSGKATSLYVPPGNTIRITAQKTTVIAICQAKSSKKTKFTVIKPQDVTVTSVGKNNWQRSVHTIINKEFGADKLIVGETYNPPGNWSSYPPHKHDELIRNREYPMEEVYFYKFRPVNGFAIQLHYSTSRKYSHLYQISEHDSFTVPHGYHPVVSAPGYELYYLWIIATEKRVVQVTEDVRYAWVRNVKQQ
ncbi:5-deoxy-glucuronate isomerase [Candidatus Microgenomates bacterium]|nr:MAG: 5-deoxy-glucuronate isomerase [Candidatus Microgenomates bacterium]